MKKIKKDIKKMELVEYVESFIFNFISHKRHKIYSKDNI